MAAFNPQAVKAKVYGAGQSESMSARDVRYGSGTDIRRFGIFVRFTHNNGHRNLYVRLYEAVAVKAV